MHICYFVAILRFVTLLEIFGQKSVVLDQKQWRKAANFWHPNSDFGPPIPRESLQSLQIGVFTRRKWKCECDLFHYGCWSFVDTD